MPEGNSSDPPQLAFLLPQPLAIQVRGEDAVRIVHNLTTNDVAKLPDGAQCETFITDQKGWTVAHCIVARRNNRIVLLGQHPDPQAVCDHVERFIIREDAEVTNLAETHGLGLLDGPSVEEKFAGQDLESFPVPMTGDHCQVLLGSIEQLVAHGFQSPDEDVSRIFELHRIRNFWPRMGVDIREKCIPQELDRDRRAISFTKGCYLGQETIARLDSRGQLQKKLCLLQSNGTVASGDRLTAEPSESAKEIGSITSAAKDKASGATFALAFLRRGNFAAGTTVYFGHTPLVVVDVA